MNEYDALLYVDEVMERAEEMSFITSEDEFNNHYLAQADDKCPYCIADQFQSIVDLEKEYAVFTQAAFLRASYEAYTNGGIEYLAEDFAGMSEAEDMDSFLDEMSADRFSFRFYLEYVMRYDSGFHFLIKDSYTVSDNRDEKNIEKNIKKFGKVETVDYNLEQVEESLDNDLW